LGYIRFRDYRVVRIVHNKPGLGAVGLFYFPALYIIDLDLVCAAAGGIVGSCGGGKLIDVIGEHVGVFPLDDHMGTGHLLGVEPPVSGVGELERQFVVLEVVLPDVDVIAVLRLIVIGAGFLRPRCSLPAGSFH